MKRSPEALRKRHFRHGINGSQRCISLLYYQFPALDEHSAAQWFLSLVTGRTRLCYQLADQQCGACTTCGRRVGRLAGHFSCRGYRPRGRGASFVRGAGPCLRRPHRAAGGGSHRCATPCATPCAWPTDERTCPCALGATQLAARVGVEHLTHLDCPPFQARRRFLRAAWRCLRRMRQMFYPMSACAPAT